MAPLGSSRVRYTGLNAGAHLHIVFVSTGQMMAKLMHSLCESYGVPPVLPIKHKHFKSASPALYCCVLMNIFNKMKCFIIILDHTHALTKQKY